MLRDPRLAPHNLHWQSADAFFAHDPALRRLAGMPRVHEPALLRELPLDVPGIYTLVGGRQVGKSTLLKQVVRDLLRRPGFDPAAAAYVTCEPFADAEELRVVLTGLLGEMGPGRPVWIFLDEVTYVPGWDRTVKFLADAGMLDRAFVLMTGSDRILIEDSLKRLPGRRGRAATADFHLRPLTFLDTAVLRSATDPGVLAELAAGEWDDPLPEAAPETLAALESELRSYHVTGGFLPAINDLLRDGAVAPATLRTYSDRIRGDVLRLDRSERFLREILAAVSDRQGSLVTWNGLASELSIDHPRTVADYVAILERMDALVVLPAVAEHLRGPAPKKARKVAVADPFIHRAALAFLGRPDAEPGSDAHLQRDLEAVVAAHAARHGETYYVKGAGEVDVAWYAGRALRLLEVKWSRQIRPEELKELRRRNAAVPPPARPGIVAGRTARETSVDGTRVLPASVVLLRLSRGR